MSVLIALRFEARIDSIAAARLSVATAMFRAVMRTVLVVQAKTVRSMNRVAMTSGARAGPRCRHSTIRLHRISMIGFCAVDSMVSRAISDPMESSDCTFYQNFVVL